MPRKFRFNLIGVPQHVIQRANNCEPCFYAEEDYRLYLKEKIYGHRRKSFIAVFMQFWDKFGTLPTLLRMIQCDPG